MDGVDGSLLIWRVPVASDKIVSEPLPEYIFPDSAQRHIELSNIENAYWPINAISALHQAMLSLASITFF